MSSTTEIYLRGHDKDAIYKLKSFVRRYGMPHYDRWNNVVHLHLDGITLKRDLGAQLHRVLVLPLATDPTGASDKEVRWISLTINELDFYESAMFVPYASYDDSDDCLDSEDVDQLCWAVANRTLRLKITRSPTFLSHFLDSDRYRCMAEKLHIEEMESLTYVQYCVLGNMIDRSEQVRELYLRLPLYDHAHRLFDGLATAFNIQDLSLHDGFMPDTGEGELILGRDGPLIKLLQHPQNQLKKLSLVNFGVKDKHLIAISELLPTSQIEFFDFSKNLIQSEGILEFAQQLPKMHSLKHFRCGSNPFWEETVTECGTIGAALLQGIKESVSLESVDDDTPLAPLLWHYPVLNRAGRRHLTSPQLVPPGLWPLILERAGNVRTYCNGGYSGERSNDNGDENSGAKCNDPRIKLMETARYSAVYFIVQHCSILALRTNKVT